MARATRLALGAVLSMMVSCAKPDVAPEAALQPQVSTNMVLISEFTGPYNGVPAFDQMNLDDLVPAIEAAMALEQEEIQAIAENPDSDHAVRFRATYYELINSALAAMRRAAAISEVTLTDSPHLGRIVWATANSVAQQAEAMYPEPETADDFVAFAARTLADGVSKAA